MNNDDTDLENELRELRPRSPSPGLESRLAEILDAARPPIGSLAVPWWQRLGFTKPLAAFVWAGASPAAAAAAIVVLNLIALKPAPAVSPETTHAEEVAQVEPESAATKGESSRDYPASVSGSSAVASSVLYQARDEGVVLAGGRSPMHRVSCRSQDTLAWRDPKTGAQWEVSYPREDVFLVPVRAQ